MPTQSQSVAESAASCTASNLVGTDEAGYGPKLGPLVIAGTRWESNQSASELAQLLESDEELALLLVDSKKLFQRNSAGNSLAPLEATALALVAVADESAALPTTLAGLVSRLVGQQAEKLIAAEAVCWKSQSELMLPLQASLEQIENASAVLRRAQSRLGIRLSELYLRCLLPSAFNREVLQHGNKANVLTFETFGIVKQLARTDRQLWVRCDKHGGRNRYAGSIMEHLDSLVDGQLLTADLESLELSRYSWKSRQDQQNVMQFTAKGESNPAVAAASILAKYVRELYMEVWNVFWCQRIPGLKATAGYPQDAGRFLSDIENDVLWRSIPIDHVVRVR